MFFKKIVLYRNLAVQRAEQHTFKLKVTVIAIAKWFMPTFMICREFIKKFKIFLTYLINLCDL